jgi:hypothetical protein
MVAMPDLPAGLRNAVIAVSDDPAKSDMELRCETCGSHVCDVENWDSLLVLARTFSDHICNQKESNAAD